MTEYYFVAFYFILFFILLAISKTIRDIMGLIGGSVLLFMGLAIMVVGGIFNFVAAIIMDFGTFLVKGENQDEQSNKIE
jgi:hypothetical protein